MEKSYSIKRGIGAGAIANTIPTSKLGENNIIPEISNKSLQKRITAVLKNTN